MQKIALLYDASQAVLSTFDLDEVLVQILSIVRDYFHITNSAVFLLQKKTQEFVVRTSIGRPADESHLRIGFGKGLIGSSAQLKRPVYASDVSRDSRYIAGFPETRSEVAIPLMVREEVVGVLDLQSTKLDAFDSEILDLLALFSTQASIALENARLYTLEQRRTKQLEAINAIARQTTAVLDLDELLGKVCDLVLHDFPVDHVVVMLLDEDKHLSIRAHKGKLTPILTAEAVFPSGTGLGARALEMCKTLVENDVKLAPDYIAGFSETRSEMCVPLIFFGEKLGALVLESATPGNFGPEDVPPLESVADICAGAIQNAHYFEKAQQLAYVDGLTGIYNRRYFEMRIASEIERCERYDGRLTVIMVDIDNFKRVNDEFGHLLGDEVLRQVSNVFVQQLRKVDVVCRYGGEEFAILVPQTSGSNALEVAEKLRRMVESYRFPGVPVKVTISIGVAEFPTHGQTRDQLVAASDAALYLSKESGRNRTSAADAARKTSA
ncbi:MAG TPA: diguanylate cyclase [Terriglobales bacterium]|nr:diguanylate cyclase [Terriglobales bacterium]